MRAQRGVAAAAHRRTAFSADRNDFSTRMHHLPSCGPKGSESTERAGQADLRHRQAAFVVFRPTMRLVFGAALAWVAILTALPLAAWLFSRGEEGLQSIYLFLPGLAAGIWLASFFLVVPLPTPRSLARAVTVFGAFLVGLSAPLIALVTVITLAEPFASPGLFGFMEVFDGPAFAPAALVGLGFGVVGWAAHRALDSRLRGCRAGWAAWLPTSAWAGVVPLLPFTSLGSDFLVIAGPAGFVAIPVLATMPHLLAQVALARWLAVKPFVIATLNA